MAWGQEIVMEGRNLKVLVVLSGVQLKHHPLLPNKQHNLTFTHQRQDEIFHFLSPGQRKQLFFCALLWSAFWASHPLAWWNSVRKIRAHTRLRVSAAQMEAPNTGSPRLVLCDKFIRTIKRFLKTYDFQRVSVYIHNTSLYADRGWLDAKCLQIQSPILSWYISL